MNNYFLFTTIEIKMSSQNTTENTNNNRISSYTKNLWIDLQLLCHTTYFDDYNNTVLCFSANDDYDKLFICLIRKTLRSLKYKILKIEDYIEDNITNGEKRILRITTNITKEKYEELRSINAYNDWIDEVWY